MLSLIVVFLSSCSLFPPPLDVTGRWSGSLIVNSVAFPMELDLVQTGISLTGHMNVRPYEYTRAIPIQSGSIDQKAKTVFIKTEQHYEEGGMAQFTLYGDCSADDYMSGTGIAASGVAVTWYASHP